MRTVLVLVVAMAACQGKSGRAPAPTTRPDGGAVAPAPVDLAQAKVTAGCLLDRARSPDSVLNVLVEDAPASTLQLAAFAAIERARNDGDSPAEEVLADAIGAFGQIDDVAGLRKAFAMVDAIPEPRSNRFADYAPARARAGVAATHGEIERDQTAVIRELVIAGDVAGATKLFATLTPGDIDDNYEQEPYLGALVALGKLTEAKALIAEQEPEDRFKMTGVWLDVALRQGAPLDDGLAAARAELAVAPDKGLLWFPERKLLQRAVRVGRTRELAPLLQARLARVTGGDKNPGLSDIPWAVAVAVGDTATAATLAADSRLASHVAVRTAPLDAALAAALANPNFPVEDLVRVWARSIADGADPTFGARLAAAVCPKPAPPRPPATPAVAGLTLTVTEKARKKRFECDNHDVVVRLVDGKNVVDEAVLEGECHGPCTTAEQREGRAQLEQIQAEIEAGTASESQTDYNFTECMFAGPNLGRTDRVGGRDIALIADHYIGAHDVDNDAWRLALEVCGALHLTGSFGGMYTGSWALDQLRIREAAGQIIVDGASEKWRGVVFRLTLPACPGTPEEQALETE